MENRRYAAGRRPLPSLARYSRQPSMDGIVGAKAASQPQAVFERPKSYINSSLSSAPKLDRQQSNFGSWLDLRSKSAPKTEASMLPLNLSLESVSAASVVPLTLASVGSFRLSQKIFKWWSAPWLLYFLAVILFAVGIYVAADGWFLNRQVSEQVGVLSAQNNEQQPTPDPGQPAPAAPVSAPASQPQPLVCNGAKDAPSAISLPSIGVRACVVPIGIGAGNQLESPKNLSHVGWYGGSAKPGSNQGAMVFDGHSGWANDQGVGVFSGASKLKPAAEIRVEYGDGKKQLFAVRDVKVVKLGEVNMGEVLRSADSSKLGLNLITCAGNYDKATGDWDSRIIVHAVQK